MKKFFVGALAAVMLMTFCAFTEAAQVEQENICCRGYCYQNCDDQGGEYCGRYGCGQGNGQGGEYCGRYGCGQGNGQGGYRGGR